MVHGKFGVSDVCQILRPGCFSYATLESYTSVRFLSMRIIIRDQTKELRFLYLLFQSAIAKYLALW